MEDEKKRRKTMTTGKEGMFRGQNQMKRVKRRETAREKDADFSAEIALNV